MWLLLAAAAAMLLVCSPAWRVLRVFVTVAHELGHAAVASVTGARVRRVRLRLDTSGMTEWESPRSAARLRSAAVAWAGYPAPAMVAVVAAAVLPVASQVCAGVLAVTVAAAAVRWARSVAAVVVMVAAAGLLAVGAWYAPQLCVAVVCGLLAAGGLRAAVEHHRQRRAPGSDAAMLAQLSRVPAWWWSASMAAVSAAAVVAVGWVAATSW